MATRPVAVGLVNTPTFSFGGPVVAATYVNQGPPGLKLLSHSAVLVCAGAGPASALSVVAGQSGGSMMTCHLADLPCRSDDLKHSSTTIVGCRRSARGARDVWREPPWVAGA